MNSTINKEKWWIYLIFLFVGIISLFIGFFIGNGLLDGGLLAMLLPLPICSVLLHLVIKYYGTEKYSFTFVFLTLAASIIIFLIGYIVPLGAFFLLLILFAIGSIIFKNDRHKKFALTAFTISFATIFLIFGATFALAGYNHLNSTEISADLLQTEPDEFFVLTEQNLDEYPAIREAITNQSTTINNDEDMRTTNFLREKGSYNVKYGDRYYRIFFVTP
jgi:predicted membrane protein